MLAILTPSPVTGRVATGVKQFISAVLRGKQGWQLQSTQGEDLPKGVCVFMRPVSKPVALKMRDPRATGPNGAAKKVWTALGPPGKFADCYGTFWVSPVTGHMCVGIPNPMGVPWAWRSLLAWWLHLALKMDREQKDLRYQWKWEENPSLDRLFQENGLCSFDIETNGFAGGITHFGFADSLSACSWEWTSKTRIAVTAWLAQSRPKVAQNYVFDVPRLEKDCGVSLIGPLHDTMAMRSVYTRQWPYGLQFLMSQFTCTNPWKTDFKTGHSNDLEYNAKDAQATLVIAQKLIEIVPSLAAGGLRC
jgi:hypothetical protein